MSRWYAGVVPGCLEGAEARGRGGGRSGPPQGFGVSSLLLQRSPQRQLPPPAQLLRQIHAAQPLHRRRAADESCFEAAAGLQLLAQAAHVEASRGDDQRHAAGLEQRGAVVAAVVAIYAFLPAVVSYIALLYLVHLEALKMDMPTLPKAVQSTGTQAMLRFGLVTSSIVILVGAIYWAILLVRIVQRGESEGGYVRVGAFGCGAQE
mgnify:CR=1 FL=1